MLYAASTFGHLASFHKPYLSWLAEQGVTVHAAAGGKQVELPGVSRYIPVSFEKSMFSPRNFAAVVQLRRLIREEQYDMISVHTSLAAFFTRLAVMLCGRKRPVVMNTAHGYLFDRDTPGLKRELLLAAERMTAPVTDWLLTMNRQDERIARQYHLGRRIVQTDGMGIDLERFKPPAAEERAWLRRQLALKDNQLVLIYAAEFSGRKHQSMLIEAMTDLPERVVLLLPGRGALLDECRALTERLDLSRRVRFPGFVSDMENYYRAADVCVSSSRSEGLPFNVMEAMACGLPAILTNVKGHEDLVQQGVTGELYPYDDRQAFCRAVRVMESDTVRRTYGEKAEKNVQKYGIDTVFQALSRLYYEALTGKADGASEEEKR